MKTKAYVKYEERVEELENGKYHNLFQGLYNCNSEEELKQYSEEHEAEFKKYDLECGDFTKKVIEPSYKEIYKMFREWTGHQLRYYKIDYDWFKLSVDENLAIDDVVYWFDEDILKSRMLRSAECWEEQRN